MGDRRVALRLTRRYAASPAEVWAALTEPASIARWLGRPVQIEVASGGTFRLQFTADETTRLDGRIRELDPGRVLELDWSVPGELPSVVRFELAEDGDGSLLVLDHRLLEERVGQGYAHGWERHLGRLESLVDEEVAE
jgi:uncharacterized protein YndB with AHSA1/START domain